MFPSAEPIRFVAIEYLIVNASKKGEAMATMTLSRLRQARYAILGFGCNQAFLFAMLYLGSYNESSQHGFLIDRPTCSACSSSWPPPSRS